MSEIGEIFSSFQEYLDNEHGVREGIRSQVRELEATAREALILLQAIHQSSGAQDIQQACERARSKFVQAREQLSVLGAAVPPSQYYRFHDHWRFVAQRLTFLVALAEYLESGRLASREEVANQLGLKCRQADGFHLDLEDYLIGLLQLASELARFSVNAVTAGDYARPMHVSQFMGDLSAGFRLLNLKNDSLRKRFDALKYDVKKVEEVVYDLSIRGLKPGETEASSGDSAPAQPSGQQT